MLARPRRMSVALRGPSDPCAHAARPSLQLSMSVAPLLISLFAAPYFRANAICLCLWPCFVASSSHVSHFCDGRGEMRCCLLSCARFRRWVAWRARASVRRKQKHVHDFVIVAEPQAVSSPSPRLRMCPPARIRRRVGSVHELLATMSDSDSEWLAIGGDVVPRVGPGAVVAARAAPIADAAAGALAIVAVPAPPRGGGLYGAPSTRTAAQKAALAARMREKKAQKRADRLQTENDSIKKQARQLVLSDGSQLSFSGEGGEICLDICSRNGRSSISGSTCLTLAYCRTQSSYDLADRFSVTRPTVLRTRVVVAQAFLTSQKAFLQRVAETADPETLAWAVVCEAWDETEERLFIKLFKGTGKRRELTMEQQNLKWHILVSRRAFQFGWLADGEIVKQEFAAVAPIVPLSSTSASVVYEGLYAVPCARLFKSLNDSLAEYAGLFFLDT